jgi:hypothetical protein
MLQPNNSATDYGTKPKPGILRPQSATITLMRTLGQVVEVLYTLCSVVDQFSLSTRHGYFITVCTVLHNRVHWFILHGLLRDDVGFVNMYAPHDNGARCDSWNQMMLTLPNTCSWIMLGDFNIFEQCCDKTSSCGKMIP